MARLKKPFPWMVLLAFMSFTSYSQSFQDFKKQIREDYTTFEKETQQKFNDFVTQIDAEFSDYLGENFEPYTTENQDYEPSGPKPDIIPQLEEIEISNSQMAFEIQQVGATYQGPVFPGIKKTEDIQFEVRKLDVNFLGWPLYFHMDEAFYSLKLEEVSPMEISNYWTEMSKVNYNHFLYQFSEVSNTLNLNTWGYFQLIKACSQSLYPSDKNMQVLFQWGMLSRMRFKAKIGYNEAEVFLLLPSVYTFYQTDYINTNGITYYVMDGKGKNIQTYEKDFPEADILMDVSITKPFNTNPIKKSRNFNFTHENKKQSVKLEFDEEMILFYQSIPLSDITVYFNSVASDMTKRSVGAAFKPLLKGKTDLEAANLLLAFVQKAFDYKTDQAAYKQEKYFFADELLHYPYSDCEDRSVLFAYLVKTLLNKEVLALGFSGHMATAVNIGDAEDGLHILYNNKVFLLADPTFYNAPLGVVMSDVMDQTAMVYPLDKNSNQKETASKVWKQLNAYGGLKADRLKDVIFDKDGNIYACGYYSGKADFNGQIMQSKPQERDVFVAKFDDKLKLLWVSSASGDGNDMAFSLAFASDGMLYVYGSMENNLVFSGVELVANGASDVFLAKYDTFGKLLWVNKAGIDKLNHSMDFMFATTFNPDGEKIMAKLYSSTEVFSHYGLDVDQDGNALIKGSFYATSGMGNTDYVNYNTGEALDIPKELHEKDLELKEAEYEATIAGLFAALNILKSKPIAIQGSDIKNTFNTYNNNFKDYASGIFTNLSNMKFLKNERGIIAIKTTAEKDLLIDKIKIVNNARIRIVKYKSGNIQVEVLSGIFVGESGNWLDMNSIKLFRASGDLLFDFDYDHTVKKINLKKEILKQ